MIKSKIKIEVMNLVTIILKQDYNFIKLKSIMSKFYHSKLEKIFILSSHIILYF